MSRRAMKYSRYYFLYEISANTDVHFLISVALVWNVIEDVIMVFIALKHSIFTSHSFAFYNITKISFIKRSIISSGC